MSTTCPTPVLHSPTLCCYGPGLVVVWIGGNHQQQELIMAADHKATSRKVLALWSDNLAHQPVDYIAANYANHPMDNRSRRKPFRTDEADARAEQRRREQLAAENRDL